MHLLPALPHDPSPVRPDATASPEPDRWEWRTFGCTPALRQRILSSASPATTSTIGMETYFVARHSLRNVKIRQGVLDVKDLVAVSPDGLEQWHPVAKAAFPLPRAVLALLGEAWHLDMARGAETADTLAALVEQSPEVRAFQVRKWRRTAELHGCRLDRVTLLIDGNIHESFSFEHAEPRVLRHLLARLGVSASSNTSYPAMLRQLAGWPALDPRQAVTAASRG